MHFQVGVISKNFLMAKILTYPYNEGRLFDPVPDSEWIGMMRIRREYLAKYGLYGEYLSNPQDYLERHKNVPEYVKYVEEDFPRILKMQDEELLYYPKIDRTRWDEIQVGGRYNNDLLLKNGRRANAARIRNIDWEGMQRERNQHYHKQFDQCTYRQLYHDEADYIRTESAYHTGMVLDELGWHEPNLESSDTVPAEIAIPWMRNWFDRFIRPANPKSLFIVLDIHYQ